MKPLRRHREERSGEAIQLSTPGAPTPRPFHLVILGLLLGATTASFAATAADLPPDQVEFFETKIRPIFVESCYKCHSEREGKSKGSLTLDSRDALRRGGATGPAFVAGDPDQSLLIQAVRYTDEDLQMPPEKDGAGGKLSAEKIAALEQWIKMGAPDPRTATPTPATLDMTRARQHWAFQPIAQPAAPSVQNQAWVQSPLDAFVLAKLEKQKLAPAPAADPRTLLRRVTYDLTGLPPTPAEVDAFLRDHSPEAYATVVDRLLASPRYGERWGRYWLDVARYADTQGYLVGNAERRFAYAHTYRDYVIRAFNTDEPYDQFLLEQLAADQLPLGDDKSALAAMGFLTLGRRFLGNQNDIIDDRIDVVTRGLMGLTVACARCHDHKFDPIPTRDYYALHGVFASTEEPAVKPLLGKLDESAPAYREFLRKKTDAEARVKVREREEVEKFLTEIRSQTGDYLLGAHDAARLPPTEKLDLFAGARKLNVEMLKRWQPWLEARAQDPTANSVLAPWFALAALPAKEFAEAARALLAAPMAEILGAAPPREKRPRSATPPTSSPDGPAAALAAPPELLAHLRLPADAPPASPFNAVILAALTEKPLSSLKDAAAVYNRVFADIEKSWQTLRTGQIEIEYPVTFSDPDHEAIRQILYAGGAPANLGYDATAKIIKRTIDDKTSGLRREVEALNWTEPGAPLRAMSLVDRAKPHNSPIFLRGNPSNSGPEAPRRFLEILGGDKLPAATTTSGRLELARAVASPANPLTARVFVNRVWGWHFGQALVRTPSDFGVRTEAPVHRDLLDYLSATFVAGGWSVKKLQRAIVLSTTYRQSGDETPAAAAIDPDNQLLHRFNRRRLEFESLRDTLLAVSGQLNLTPGGLPDDLTTEPFTRRRTVYGFIDRQNLPGMFRTFDFPNPDTSSAQRFATTVPQQALFMMNSPFAQEQARHLVQRPELQSAASDPEKIRALYATLYQRAPAADELALAQDFLATQQASPHATPPSPDRVPGWHYGYGAFDSATRRVRDFQPMTARKDGKDARISPSPSSPDSAFDNLFLSPTGGHPGKTPNHASIRRWIAPAAGTVRLEATLGHANEKGDGIHARIISSRTGSLGEWTVHNAKQETNLADQKVTAGEALDFLVESGATTNSDTYTWSPKIHFTADADSSARTWDAKRDFNLTEKIPVPLTPWEALAQVLLLANELAFVD
ncbi:MAG: DUF1549 domain-containing protein [Opitutus sp.]|nr:DUF1549 domain-containing protein [Opitutus sp.]